METKTVTTTATTQNRGHKELLNKKMHFCHLRICKMVRTARLQRTTMTHPATVPKLSLSDLKLLAKQLARSPKMCQRNLLRAITALLPTMNRIGRM